MSSVCVADPPFSPTSSCVRLAHSRPPSLPLSLSHTTVNPPYPSASLSLSPPSSPSAPPPSSPSPPFQRIGDSLKKETSKGTKTGRFGVGFNSVYHLTDLPTFVSDRFVVMFDPQAKHLPNVNPSNPGKMIDFVKVQCAGREEGEREGRE